MPSACLATSMDSWARLATLEMMPETPCSRPKKLVKANPTSFSFFSQLHPSDLVIPLLMSPIFFSSFFALSSCSVRNFQSSLFLATLPLVSSLLIALMVRLISLTDEELRFFNTCSTLCAVVRMEFSSLILWSSSFFEELKSSHFLFLCALSMSARTVVMRFSSSVILDFACSSLRNIRVVKV